jgi:hypothetical protein
MDTSIFSAFAINLLYREEARTMKVDTGIHVVMMNLVE